MSKSIDGFISWIRTFLDDVYANSSHNHDSRYYTESEMDTALNQKQNTLISGTTIKTINGQSLLDRGNIQIDSGSFDFAEIPQGDDLDDYNWQGAFYCTSAYSTISNIPITSPFVVTVDGDVNVLQTFVDLTNKDIYTRICFNSTFSAWKKQATSDDLLEKTYPIGAIYMSVNSTSPSTLFGGTWQQLEDTFLFATSGTADTGYQATAGSKDAVVVEHNHTQASHNQGSGDNTYPNFMTTNINIAVGQTKRTLPAAGSNYYYVYTQEKGDISQHSVTDSKQPAINNKGESGTNKNMPPYMKVYAWKRIS